MDGDNLTGMNFADLDLNQEPIDPPLPSVTRFGPLLNELETFRGRIEERIRLLEGVASRERQRQNWCQDSNPVEISQVSTEMVAADAERGIINPGIVGTTVEKGRGCKRNGSHLVMRALEMNSDVKEAEKEGGSFYDCNICLDMARNPILTCCGHLFCWACFYEVSDVDSNSKECPVCKGEVSNSSIVPIYGNGESEQVHDMESGLKIPPRPKAQRIESVRQQQHRRVVSGLSHVPVLEALRRIRMGVGATGHQPQQEADNNVIVNFRVESQEEPNTEAAAGGPQRRIYQVSRVLSESAASLSSLSSALSDAERLVEDLESVINNRFPQRESHTSSDVGGNRFRLSHHEQTDLEHRPPESADPSSSQLSDDSGHILPILSMNPITLYSLRRRNIIARTPNRDNRDTRPTRRRRLNEIL